MWRRLRLKVVVRSCLSIYFLSPKNRRVTCHPHPKREEQFGTEKHASSIRSPLTARSGGIWGSYLWFCPVQAATAVVEHSARQCGLCVASKTSPVFRPLILKDFKNQIIKGECIYVFNTGENQWLTGGENEQIMFHSWTDWNQIIELKNKIIILSISFTIKSIAKTQLSISFDIQK